jgi:hypothetical protein
MGAALDDHAIAGRDAIALRRDSPDVLDAAHDLVAEDHRDGRRQLARGVLHVRAAVAAQLDAHDRVVITPHRRGEVAQLERIRAGQDERTNHQVVAAARGRHRRSGEFGDTTSPPPSTVRCIARSESFIVSGPVR